MLKELSEFLKLREERMDFGGVKVVVRELATAEDLADFADQGEALYALVVRCTFDEAGKKHMFVDADIPQLKTGSKMKLMPLIEAVNRVNGQDLEGEIKNSEAVHG